MAPLTDGGESRSDQTRPIVCITATEDQIGKQTIRNWTTGGAASSVDAFLFPSQEQPLRPESAELAALAVWGGRERLVLPDGSIALSRKAFLAQTPHRIEINGASTPAPQNLGRLTRHLSNANLLSITSWTRHPLRTAGRLIPLRLKEYANTVARRQVFDLRFYLRFRPNHVPPHGEVRQALVYNPIFSPRRRIGLITPHLGAGGAETVLLNVAASLDRSRCELFLFATQSQDSEGRGRWEAVVDHVYDLQELVGFDNAAAAIYSIAVNWQIETLLVQNSLVGYSILPQLKFRLPSMRIIDVIHSVDQDWNILEATREVSSAIDVRVAISETVRSHLRRLGAADAKIRLIRNAVDLRRFSPCPLRASETPFRILFAGRLDSVKRPLLLPDIAAELLHRHKKKDFQFVIAGDGPEKLPLINRVKKKCLDDVFDFRGFVEDIRPVLCQCDVLILPSCAEGIPLIILEAFSCSRTVIASAVGGVPEIVTPQTGIAIPCGPTEVRQFVEALNELRSNLARRDALAKAGRKLVEQQFNVELFHQRYRTLLEQN